MTSADSVGAIRTRLGAAGWAAQGPTDRLDHVRATGSTTLRLRSVPGSPRLFFDATVDSSAARIVIVGGSLERMGAVDLIVAHQDVLGDVGWRALGDVLLGSGVDLLALSPDRESETPIRDAEDFERAMRQDDDPDLETEDIDFSDDSLWPDDDELADDDEGDAQSGEADTVTGP